MDCLVIIMLSDIRQSEKTNTKCYDSNVESNEQTELTSKTDRLTGEGQMTSSMGRRLGGDGIEQKGKRTHGH